MPQVLRPPSSEYEWKKIAQDFWKTWNFPLCLGAIDGKHVVIQAPAMAGSEYFNYKGTHSIVLLAVCDARYCFTLLDIGGAGRHSDGGVFANSAFGQKFMSNNLSMPTIAQLPGSDMYVPHCIVGDAAFPLKPNIMRPYPGKNLSHERAVFNYRLSRARRVIENTFGILATRWRIFRRPIIADVNKVIAITKAACCLHNFLQIRNSYASPYVDREDSQGNITNGQWRSDISGSSNLHPIGRVGTNMHSSRAREIRDAFKDYFNSNLGRMPGQDAIVDRI